MTNPREIIPPTSFKGKASPTGWGLALEKTPQFLSVLLLFTLPFLTQSEGQDPLFLKYAVAEIIIFLMLGAWALRIFLTGKLVWVSSRVIWIVGALLVWGLITLLCSSYSKAGFLQMEDDLIYPIWYLLLTFTCLEAWQAENLLVSFLIAGLATSLWAFGQVLGVSEDGWTAVVKNQFSGKPAAGFGNPDILAGFLTMVWPLALALWIRAASKASQFLWGSVSVLSLTTIFLTGSPGGWFGMTVGTAVFVVFIFKEQKLEGLKWFALPVVLIVASFFVQPMSNSLKGFEIPLSETVQFQKQVWRGTMDMITERPFLGAGYGTFATAFPSHRPPFLVLRQPQRASEIAHATNWFLEWTAETGVIGVLLLMTFWFYVLAQWWKLYRAHAISKPLGAGVFATVAAVAADNLLDSNSYFPSTLIPLLFLAAFPVALSQRFYRLEGFPIQRKETDITRWKIYFLPILALVMVLVFLKIRDAFQRQGAQLDLKKAAAATSRGQWNDALNFYDNALKLDGGNLLARYCRGTVYLNRNQANDLEKSLDDFKAVEQISPDYHLIHYQMYEALLRLGSEEEAKEELKRAVRLDPTLVYLLDDFKKARNLTSKRQFEEALIIYQNLYFDYPTCVPMIVSFGNCMAIAGDLNSAIKLYQRALQLDPGNDKALDNLQKVWSVLKQTKESGNPKAHVIGAELE